MHDEETKPKKPRLTLRDGLMLGAGTLLGGAATYVAYRLDPVPAVVQLTREEIQLLLDGPNSLLSKGFKGKIAIVQKSTLPQ